MAQARRNGTDEAVAQLKNDIDSGRTGSKIATADPGLSPLGTDDEAAGRPASRDRIATARAEEKRIGEVARAADPLFPRRLDGRRDRGGRGRDRRLLHAPGMTASAPLATQ